MRELNIIYQSSEEYSFMIGVSVSSLIANASPDIKYSVYIFQSDYTDETKEKFRNIGKINKNINYYVEFVDVSDWDEYLQKLNVKPHRDSYATYYKLFFDRFFKDKEIDRLLFIDADSLVLGDLHELLDFDFCGTPFAMNWTEKQYERYHPRGIRTCIPAVILFNIPVWRKMRCEERIVRHINEIGAIYGSADQGILNVEFSGDYIQLPLRYNVYSFALHFNRKNQYRFHDADILTKAEIEDAIDNPQIIHYARSFLYRPCEKDSIFPNKELWWSYCNESPWKGMKEYEEGREIEFPAKIFRLMYKTKIPINILDHMYVVCRKFFSFLLNVTHPAKEKWKIGRI